MLPWTAVFLLLAGCGDNGDRGDTILTGFSGVLIFGIIVWIVYVYIKGRT